MQRTTLLTLRRTWLAATVCLLAAPSASTAQTATSDDETPAIVSYSFDQAADDANFYDLTLQGTARLVSLTDGNHVLSTGSAGGYADLGQTMGREVMAQLDGDFSISIDLCPSTSAPLSSFCWAWAFANGTNRYVAMVNAAGNGNWYYEIKRDAASQSKTNKGLATDQWHTLTVVQRGGNAETYIDGTLCASSAISLHPSEVAAELTQCWLGRSPFSGDAYLTHTLIDNFCIYDRALSADEVQQLSSQRPTVSKVKLTPEEQQEALRIELEAALAARYIHRACTLPTECSLGPVEWTYDETTAGYASFDGTQFTVVRRPDDDTAIEIGTLQGTIGTGEEAINVFETPIPVRVAPDDNAVGYLYCHMPDLVPQPGTGTLVSQTITYALGREEDLGFVYNELNHGDAIIPGIGTTLPWCRDAFIAKDTLRHCYYIVTTDLYGSRNGGTSMLGNFSIGMFRSYDLINWTYSRADVRRFLAANPPTDIYDNSGKSLLTSAKVTRVWAPQIIFIDNTPYIYYALGNSDNGDCDHFYISRANESFTNIETFQLLYGPNKVDNILDADINYLHTDQLYHMSLRDYEAGCIRDITCADLLNPEWNEVSVTTFTDGNRYEASSVFRRINDDVWNIGNVNYGNRRGFHFHTADALLRNLKGAPDLTGNLSPQHGSFIMVNQQEWDVLQAWSDLRGLVENAKRLYNKTRDSELRQAIIDAQNHLKGHGADTQMDVLARELEADCQTLRQLIASVSSNHTLPLTADDIHQLLERSTELDINNGDFSTSAEGWTANPAPTTSNGVAEFFAQRAVSYTANLNQTLTGLEPGDYLVTCQAFERSGHNSWSDGYPYEYENGCERLHYRLFANNDSTNVASLYSLTATGTNTLNGFANGMTSASNLFSQSPDNYLCGIVTTVGTSGTLTFGLHRPVSTVHTSDWCCFDNFRVYRLNDELPDGIKEVKSEKLKVRTDDVNIYDMTGRHLETGNASSATCQTSGIVVLKQKMSDGTVNTRKVLMR